MCEAWCSLHNEGRVAPVLARIRVLLEFGCDDGAEPSLCYCRWCESPACVEVCPVGALVPRQGGGVAGFDPAACIGCGKCAELCPYSAVRLDVRTGYPVVCTGCGTEDPVCVAFCPTGSLALSGSPATRGM